MEIKVCCQQLFAKGKSLTKFPLLQNFLMGRSIVFFCVLRHVLKSFWPLLSPDPFKPRQIFCCVPGWSRIASLGVFCSSSLYFASTPLLLLPCLQDCCLVYSYLTLGKFLKNCFLSKDSPHLVRTTGSTRETARPGAGGPIFFSLKAPSISFLLQSSFHAGSSLTSPAWATMSGGQAMPSLTTCTPTLSQMSRWTWKKLRLSTRLSGDRSGTLSLFSSWSKEPPPGSSCLLVKY